MLIENREDKLSHWWYPNDPLKATVEGQAVPALDGEGWTENQWYKPFTLEEVQLFELWFQFSVRSDYSKWSADMKKHFTNVTPSSGTPSWSFPKWWWRHNVNFRKIRVRGVHEYDEDPEWFQQLAEQPDPNVLVVAVFVDGNLNDLQRTFASLVNQRLKDNGVSRRPKEFGERNDLFGLFYRENARRGHSVKHLWDLLEIYDECSKPNPKRNEEIEQLISDRRIDTNLDTLIDREKIRYDEGSGGREERKWDDWSGKKNCQKSTIARAYTKASKIIAHLQDGKFPCSDDHPSVGKWQRRKKRLSV